MRRPCFQGAICAAARLEETVQFESACVRQVRLRLSASDSTFCKSPSAASLKIQLRRRVFGALKIFQSLPKRRKKERKKHTERRLVNQPPAQRLKLRYLRLKRVVTTGFFLCFCFFFLSKELKSHLTPIQLHLRHLTLSLSLIEM